MHCAALLLAVLSVGQAATAQQSLTPDQWRADLAVYLEQVPRAHVAPYRVMPPDTLRAGIERLAARIPGLQRHQIIVELARITAGFGDGHTGIWLTPNAANGFHQLPILPYWTEDGLYVLGIDDRYADLVGGRIVSIGGVDAAEALERVGPLIGRDNTMQVRDIGGRYLAIPEILHAVGLTGHLGRATYRIAQVAGPTVDVTLEAIPDAWLSHLSSRPWVRRTADDRIGFRIAYDTAAPPLWLRHPERAQWFTPLPAQRAVYAQVNRIGNDPEQTMATFIERLFAVVDSVRPERLVLDLRLNGGGNNFLNLPLVLAIVRRPWLDRRGGVFVLVSRHTFSAASHLVTYLERLTNAAFVGEPTGGSPDHYGDAATVVLPASGLEVRASTIFWQNSLPARFEPREWTAPDLAVPFRVAAYRAGEDPALEVALSWEPELTLAEQLRQAADGGVAALRAQHRSYRANPLYRWVDDENALNALGYALLSEGRVDAGVAVFRLNAEDHPESANAFDSLGDGLIAQGDTTAAVAAWRQALRIDPAFAPSAGNLRRLGLLDTGR